MEPELLNDVHYALHPLLLGHVGRESKLGVEHQVLKDKRRARKDIIL